MKLRKWFINHVDIFKEEIMNFITAVTLLLVLPGLCITLKIYSKITHSANDIYFFIRLYNVA